MHEAGVERTARNLLSRHDTRLRVERQDVEHFRQLPRCPLVQEPMHVLRATDVNRLRLSRVRLPYEAHPRWPELRGESHARLQGLAALGTAPDRHTGKIGVIRLLV